MLSIKCTLCKAAKQTGLPRVVLSGTTGHLSAASAATSPFLPLSARRRGWFPSSYTKLLEENAKEAVNVPSPR